MCTTTLMYYVRQILCTHTLYNYSSYMTLIEVHEMHGRVHPSLCHVTDLLVVDLCSSLAYFMMTHPLPIAGKLPIKTLVARQLPTKYSIQCRCLHALVHTYHYPHCIVYNVMFACFSVSVVLWYVSWHKCTSHMWPPL